MKKFLLVLVLVLVCFGTLQAVAAPPNLIIIGWDGAGLKSLKPLLDQGRLPVLSQLLNNGHYLYKLQNISATCTNPTWTMFFTGMTYDQTGASGNPRLKTPRDFLTYRKKVTYRDPPSLTLDNFGVWIEPLPPHWFFPAQLKLAYGHRIGWFLCKKFIGAATDEYGRAMSDFIAKAVSAYSCHGHREEGEPYLTHLVRDTLGFMQRQHAAGKPYVLWTQMDIDDYGHLHGEGSAEYLHEFERCDAAVDRILKAALPGTYVIIAADHGFDEGRRGHHDAPDSWMITNLPIKPIYRYGNNYDVAATMRDVAKLVYRAYDIDPVGPIPSLRGMSIFDAR